MIEVITYKGSGWRMYQNLVLTMGYLIHGVILPFLNFSTNSAYFPISETIPSRSDAYFSQFEVDRVVIFLDRTGIGQGQVVITITLVIVRLASNNRFTSLSTRTA